MDNTVEYQVIDAVDASIYWKDLFGKYLGCNEYMAKMAGKKRNEIIGNTDYFLPWKDQANKIREVDLLVVSSLKRYEAEETATIYDGVERVFLSTKSPLLDENDNVIGVIGVSIDITHQKRFEEEFRLSENSLSEYSSVKTRFLNNISHETRIPLGSVLSVSELLKDNWYTFDDKTKFENINLIFKEATRLSRFILNTFDISDFSKNGIRLNLQKSNFSIFLKDTVNKYTKTFCDTKVDVNINHFDDFLFSFDKLLIARVIENLLMNALEYSPKRKSITIGLYKTCLKNTDIPAIHCCIKDEGVGIPEKELNSIFNVFTESSRTASKASGVGLGLSICKEIVEAHLGTIWAENNSLTSGVTFNFTLPTNLLTLPNNLSSLNNIEEEKSISSVESNIIKMNLTTKSCCSKKKPFALIGISPFNSYFSTEKISEIYEWINNEYNDFAIFIPDGISKYTFEALGYTKARTDRKTKKQDNYTINKVNSALSHFYEKHPEKNNIKLHTISKLKEHKSYSELYQLYSNLFISNKEFRNSCLEVTEWVLSNNNSKGCVIDDFQKNIAVQYFLYELPIMTYATDILKIESCDFVYHSIPKFLKNLYLSKELVSPTQRFLILE